MDRDNKIKAIIFDMDGVIVDSEPLHVEAELATCEHFEVDAPGEVWQHFKGTTSMKFWGHLIDNYARSALDINEVVNFCSKSYLEIAKEKLAPIKGSLEFIKFARVKFGKLALVTSGLRAHQEMVFEKFGLFPYFDAITTGNDIIHGKPHPEPYNIAVSKIDMPAENCMVIEDSDNGIISAKGAGCLAVGITTTFSKDRLERAGANFVVNDYEELISFF